MRVSPDTQTCASASLGTSLTVALTLLRISEKKLTDTANRCMTEKSLGDALKLSPNAEGVSARLKPCHLERHREVQHRSV